MPSNKGFTKRSLGPRAPRKAYKKRDPYSRKIHYVPKKQRFGMHGPMFNVRNLKTPEHLKWYQDDIQQQSW